MAATVSFGRPWATRIYSICPLWMESKALVKSTNIIVVCRFLVHTSSRIPRIVKICDVVDLFRWKPFWFFKYSFLAVIPRFMLTRSCINIYDTIHGHLPLTTKTILVRRTRHAGTSSSMMYSYGPLHMAEQKQDDQLEHTYCSYVRIKNTCQRRWTIGKSGERGQGYPC